MKAMLLSATMLSVAATYLVHPANALADESKAVEQATAQFYASLNALFTGDAKPMLAVWSHADDVSYMGPGGDFQVGWDEVREVWHTQAALKLGGKIEPTKLRVTVGEDLAFTQCIETGTNFDADGNIVHVSIRATNLFRKENGTWKMIGHHTDVLPFLRNESLASSTR